MVRQHHLRPVLDQVGDRAVVSRPARPPSAGVDAAETSICRRVAVTHALKLLSWLAPVQFGGAMGAPAIRRSKLTVVVDLRPTRLVYRTQTVGHLNPRTVGALVR